MAFSGQVVSNLYDTTNLKKEECYEVESVVWELKRFKALLHLHTTNESKSGDEECPLRVSHIDHGTSVDRPSKYSAKLYLSKFDQNNNCATETKDDVLFRLEVDTLDIGQLEGRTLYTSTTIRFYTGKIKSFREFRIQIGKVTQKSETSCQGQLQWNKLQKSMDLEDSLFILVQHYIYRQPSEWGLPQVPGILEAIDKYLKYGTRNPIRDESMKKILVEFCEGKGLTKVIEDLNIL